MNLNANSLYYDINNIKSEVDFDTNVIEYLNAIGYVRRGRLVNYLMETHPNERGYSKKSIDRKLANMTKTGILTSLKYDELQKYGIKETDKRASYPIPKKTLKMKEDFDKTFSYLNSADVTTKKLILEEISRYERKYVLDPYQLDILAKHLDTESDELVDSLLEILFRYITEKDIEPSNTDTFLERLRSTLKHYKVSPDEYPMLRRHITWLLGYYKDSFVIEQLKMDAETLEYPSSVKCDYCDQLIAPFIAEHSLELFNFQMELKRKGKEEASEIISQIKDEASNPKPRLMEF
ncbi:hypothetical protein [Methanococcoides sp. NM1]|uniref:hypothetical protein n=1 Tax=Methanococcoides sp. NM1 TaxID=1201013 RepID=UPI00108362BC|nr:hypothetical protein [Methanococcoides sp. NM1]